MASEGPLSPGSATNNLSIGTISWSNASNITASDDVRAGAGTTPGAQTNYLLGYNFGFAIPAGATIDGIKVEIERATGGGGSGTIQDYSVIIKSNGASSNNKADTVTSWTASDTYKTYGGSTDTWGLSAANLDPTHVNDNAISGFSIYLSASRTGGSGNLGPAVDHYRVTVYYTEPAAGFTGWGVPL